MAEVTSWDFLGQRLVKDFKIIFRVKNFNNLFLFLNRELRRGCFFLDSALEW